MKFKVIQGEKGKKPDETSKEMPKEMKGKKGIETHMDDYYAKERPHSQDMEQAEGDEDIVNDALKRQDNQGKTGDAA